MNAVARDTLAFGHRLITSQPELARSPSALRGARQWRASDTEHGDIVSQDASVKRQLSRANMGGPWARPRSRTPLILESWFTQAEQRKVPAGVSADGQPDNKGTGAR
jgi:hypothetical protein